MAHKADVVLQFEVALPSLLDAELVVLFPEGLECKVLIIKNTKIFMAGF